MKHFIIICVLLNTLVHAKDSQFFFGLGLGGGQGEHSSETLSTSVEYKDDSASYYIDDFYMGLIYDNSRVQISYTSLEVFSLAYNNNGKFVDIDTTFKGLDIDYIGTVSLFKSPRISIDGTKIPSYFKPFFLVGLGAYSGTVMDESLAVEKDVTGMAFNYGIGIYLLDNHFEYEFSYKGKIVQWMDISHAETEYSLRDKMNYFYTSIKIIF